MAGLLASNAESNLVRKEKRCAGTAAAKRAAGEKKASAAVFKYYIHDSVTTLRFELIGDLRASHVAELTGSWETARTTLSQRRLVLDATRVDSSDDKGREWLHAMRSSGAEVKDNEARSSSDAVKLGLWGKTLGRLRPKR